MKSFLFKGLVLGLLFSTTLFINSANAQDGDCSCFLVECVDDHAVVECVGVLNSNCIRKAAAQCPDATYAAVWYKDTYFFVGKPKGSKEDRNQARELCVSPEVMAKLDGVPKDEPFVGNVGCNILIDNKRLRLGPVAAKAKTKAASTRGTSPSYEVDLCERNCGNVPTWSITPVDNSPVKGFTICTTGPEKRCLCYDEKGGFMAKPAPRPAPNDDNTLDDMNDFDEYYPCSVWHIVPDRDGKADTYMISPAGSKGKVIAADPSLGKFSLVPVLSQSVDRKTGKPVYSRNAAKINWSLSNCKEISPEKDVKADVKE